MQLIEAYPHRAEADSFDFRKTLLSVQHAWRGHTRLIFITCGLTVLLAALYIVIWPPVYKSAVTLAAESDRDSTRDEFYQTWDVFRKDQLSSEVHLITTAPVLSEVVRRLHLTDKEVYHSFLAYATKLWTDSPPGKAYHAVKDFIFGKKHGPYDPTPQEIDQARTLDDFKSGIKFATLTDANVGTLTVMGPTPRVSQMADTLAQVYLEQRRARHEQEADAAYQALAVEADKAEAELTDLEHRMAQYDTKNGLVLAFEKDKLDIGQWAALRGAIQDRQTTIANDQAALAQVRAQMQTQPAEVTAARVMKTSAAREALTDKLSQLELARKQLLIHFRPDAQEVTELDRQIAVVRSQLAQEPTQVLEQSQVVLSEAYMSLQQRERQLEADLAGLHASLGAVRSQDASLRAQVDKIPEKMRVTHDLDREHEAIEKRYVTLQEKMMIAAVSRAAAASAPPTIRVVEQASRPDKASWPKANLLLPGAAIFGLGAGLLLAFLMDVISRRVNRYRLPEEVGMPVYAVVSHDCDYAAILFSTGSGATLSPTGIKEAI